MTLVGGVLDDEELSRVEEVLRAIMADAGLGWVLARLDDAISRGVAEERPLDEHWYDRLLEMARPVELPEETRRAKVSVRPRVGMANRPQTVRERVLSLLTALERVVLELPAIGQDTLLRLLYPERDNQTAVHSVQFLPDEDATDTELVLSLGGSEVELNKLVFGELLTTLKEEVQS